ncbi:glycosyltransferase family 2 protein [Hypoxylon sp. CI-4A]|nr:glycosyltransferase family 2 protein [Hypoxylon sp. CI-4A]
MDSLTSFLRETPPHTLFAAFVALVVFAFYSLYAVLHLIAPKPRAALPSERTYITTTPTGTVTRQLPCWHDRWLADRHASEARSRNDDPTQPDIADTGSIEPAEVRMSVVFPAYNEEDRILPTLKEAVEYLDATFGRDPHPSKPKPLSKRPLTPTTNTRRHTQNAPREDLSGYEILIVNDGSRDRTVEVALDFAREHELHDVLRVVTLARNRGKGGGVTHGLRHVRGEYALFADADGASRFSDLARLVEGCEEVVDGSRRGVAIGSRGHLVGSEAVVKRSALRNFLMRSFHLVLMILTPPATSRLRDTQCGFKLFSRAALPHIVPYMHAEGWIFDIEMLMLAESAPAVPVLGHDGAVIGSSPGIKVAEVPIDWHEVGGSKLNVIQDSIKMAVGLAVLRASWMMGVYRRRLT